MPLTMGIGAMFKWWANEDKKWIFYKQSITCVGGLVLSDMDRKALKNPARWLGHR